MQNKNQELSNKIFQNYVSFINLSIDVVKTFYDLVEELDENGFVFSRIMYTTDDKPSINFIIHFEPQPTQKQLSIIPKLATKYNFDIILSIQKQLIIKFK